MRKSSSKQRTGIPLLILLILFCLTGCSVQKEFDAEISFDIADVDYGVETAQVVRIEFNNSAGAVSYTGHEIIDTKYEDNILIVHFSFTNNIDEYQCFEDVVSCRAYQDGMEIEGRQLDTDEGDNAWREIAKGKTIDCAIAFKTTCEEPIYLRVSPVIDGSFDSSIYQEQELQII